MKKFFSRPNARGEQNNKEPNTFFGKVFTVGRFTVTVEDIIAEEGFAIIFLVKGSNNIRYCLKRMIVHSDHDLNICKREITMASSLKSQYIFGVLLDFSIYPAAEGAHEVLMLMNFYIGNCLKLINERLQSGCWFSEKEVLQIFCDVCEGISTLHHCQTPVIHRDLKVENILMSDSGHYVISGFRKSTYDVVNHQMYGVTQAEEEIKKYRTLSYKGPEMIVGSRGKPITTKVDIWALGCLLYKLCFFSLPFGENALAIQSGNFNIPDNSPYSKSIHSLIKYMLKVDPEKRPDIFQVSYVAFNIAGRKCPVTNLKGSAVPDIHKLPSPQTESEVKKATAKQQRPASTTVIQGTVIAPRKRPKGSQAPPGVASLNFLPQATPTAGKKITSTKPHGLSTEKIIKRTGIPLLVSTSIPKKVDLKSKKLKEDGARSSKGKLVWEKKKVLLKKKVYLEEPVLYNSKLFDKTVNISVPSKGVSHLSKRSATCPSMATAPLPETLPVDVTDLPKKPESSLKVSAPTVASLPKKSENHPPRTASRIPEKATSLRNPLREKVSDVDTNRKIAMPSSQSGTRDLASYLTPGDLARLDGLTWLNDTVIESYLQLVIQKSNKKIHSFNTFFYKILKEKGNIGIKAWTRKINIFNYSLIFIPIHVAGCHWSLAVIDHQLKRIKYYDSLENASVREANECLDLLNTFLQFESQEKLGQVLNPRTYATEIMQRIPRQKNGSDCGLFLLKYAECISRGAAFTFNQDDVTLFRKTVKEELEDRLPQCKQNENCFENF